MRREKENLMQLGAVYTTPEKFEDTALFLLLGLPSTLIRHTNPSRQSVTLICHANLSRKRSF